MATIDYKEKYEKAVQAAMLAKQDTESAVTIGILEEIFPELRESEDEKIRKELIKETKGCEVRLFETVTNDEFIAWLEKQGNANKEYWRGYREGKQEILDKYTELGKQGEQKPADKAEPKFNVGDEIKTSNEELLTITKIDEKGYWSDDLFICGFDDAAKWELVGQKPAWSEEDEKMIRGLIVICDEWTTRHSFYPIENCEIEKLKNWLESLKERYT